MASIANSGLWRAVATLTTVGYGDIYPVTAFGRLVGAFIAFSGIAAVAIPTGIITSGLSERISRVDASEDMAATDIKACIHRQSRKLDEIVCHLDRILKQNSEKRKSE